ncbi:hypothetical protein [Salinimicrobium sp. WS361]|uniref:hypothetical protein n=1 Tax=Salinimicrobium sp. WS361 TaxID=3425123 RepID=UPI003D6E2801
MREIQNKTKLETDYLIVGCGAVGMAFADVVLSETKASLVMVDKLHKPGGHWNQAYSFVKLHQPSAFYGVSSVDLGKEGIDKVGVNKGLQNLSSGDEIRNYYNDVMQGQFLPGGRVNIFLYAITTGTTVFPPFLPDNLLKYE